MQSLINCRTHCLRLWDGGAVQMSPSATGPRSQITFMAAHWASDKDDNRLELPAAIMRILSSKI
jgi:hypothetical protein